MDLGTIIGLIGGAALVLISIAINGAGFNIYLDLGSVLLVIGGSFGALMISNPLNRILGIVRFMSLAFRIPDLREEKIITDLVAFSERARREGLLALEDNLDEVEDEFLRKGIQLVVDGTDPEIIKSILYNELNQVQERHERGIKVFDDWGKLAPAFGMLGTLIGLIAMLANLGGDKTAIGRGMGLALITTLYGALLANLLLIPVKNKLEDRDKDETRVKEIIVEGILSIQSGDNPRILLEKLISFLPPRQRDSLRQETVRE
ncbi:MAG TPA: motility protein A [Spirochaetia bacterium]|nr:motility protein A [Spirochaetia bacterium]